MHIRVMRGQERDRGKQREWKVQHQQTGCDAQSTFFDMSDMSTLSFSGQPEMYTVDSGSEAMWPLKEHPVAWRKKNWRSTQLPGDEFVEVIHENLKTQGLSWHLTLTPQTLVDFWLILIVEKQCFRCLKLNYFKEGIPVPPRQISVAHPCIQTCHT